MIKYNHHFKVEHSYKSNLYGNYNYPVVELIKSGLEQQYNLAKEFLDKEYERRKANNLKDRNKWVMLKGYSETEYDVELYGPADVYKGRYTLLKDFEAKMLEDFIHSTEDRRTIYTPDGMNIEFHIRNLAYEFKRLLDIVNLSETANITYDLNEFVVEDFDYTRDTFQFLLYLKRYKVVMHNVDSSNSEHALHRVYKNLLNSFFGYLKVYTTSISFCEDREVYLKSYVRQQHYLVVECDENSLTLYPGVLFYMLSEYVLNPSVQRLVFLQHLKR